MRVRGCFAQGGEARGFKKLLIGPAGVRGGWRLALFLVLFIAFLFALAFAVNAGVRHFAHHGPVVPGQLTPGFILFNESLLLVPLLAAMAVMAFLEDAPFFASGLAGPAPVANLFHGYSVGLVALGLLIFGLILTGYGIADKGTLSAAGDVRYGVEWFLDTLLIGFTEELLFRGYVFKTIASGAGFWWATLVTSVVFAAGHGHNPGETFIGLLQIALMGPVFCLAIRATGSIWWGIGLHGAWDYAEKYLFGTHDSGNPCFGTLIDLVPHRNVYLSGGLTGPEGSVFGLGVPVAIGVYVWVFLERKRSLF
jgi:membrane protease YdiL (CAAX protease family)